MRAYTSRTGTRSTLAALRRAGWRLLVSATGAHRTEGFPYALDNGAWTAYRKGRPLDEGLFWQLFERLGPGADWVVCPDVVGDRRSSLRLTERWLPRLVGRTSLVLIGVQDEMTPADIAPWLTSGVGVAIGGTTPWKLDQLQRRVWAGVGEWGHCLRVNSARRIRLCRASMLHSFDGTSPIRFPSTLDRLTRARDEAGLQLDMWRK